MPWVIYTIHTILTWTKKACSQCWCFLSVKHMKRRSIILQAHEEWEHLRRVPLAWSPTLHGHSSWALNDLPFLSSLVLVFTNWQHISLPSSHQWLLLSPIPHCQKDFSGLSLTLRSCRTSYWFFQSLSHSVSFLSHSPYTYFIWRRLLLVNVCCCWNKHFGYACPLCFSISLALASNHCCLKHLSFPLHTFSNFSSICSPSCIGPVNLCAGWI